MNNLKDILNNFKLKDEIFYCDFKEKISYPDEGNEDCFKIEEESFWFKHRNNCIKNVVERNDFQNEIFDIGGGNGFTTIMLQNMGKRAILVEPGEKGVRNAKKRGVKEIACGAFDKNMFKEKIANVGLFDVVEHIENDEGFMRDIYEVLRESGKVYITVPAYRFLWSIEDEEAGHYRRYTLKKVEKLLKNVGFDIEYKTYIFSFLVLPILFFRTIFSLLNLRKKDNSRTSVNEHKTGKIAKSILDELCKREMRKIAHGKTIPFGTSCMLVAIKK